MAREIYNFLWAPPPAPEEDVPVAHNEPNTVNRTVVTTRAVILFPSLLTPLVHVDDDSDPFFELLIAFSSGLSQHPDLVNRQLKVSLGLDPKKRYDPRPLFGGSSDKITATKVGSVTTAGKEILKTASKFEGILHPSVGSALLAKELREIYAVKVHKSCLPSSTPTRGALCSRVDWKMLGYATSTERTFTFGDAVVGGELSDELILTMLEKRLGEDNPKNSLAGGIPGLCRYAFPLVHDTVDLSRADGSQPVQSYHPLVVFTPDSFVHASVGHLSDLHVNCRWQLVGKSPARVIEYGEDEHGNKYEDESPAISQILAETNRSVKNVMSEVFASDASLVIIGGDLVDHIRNTYDPRLFASDHDEPTAGDVWKAVDLDEGLNEQTYPYGVDLVAFYSFILDAIRSHKKPAFGISGNHDCYVMPFGISPRVAGLARANEGIPADLNLTFYEAVLAFGPTSDRLTKFGSSFDEAWFEWFYLVFSPFNDWWHKLPNQSLVGLGWGNAEDILGVGGDQGLPAHLGHLPRSSEGVSSTQLQLMKDAVAQEATHKVTLTTHFTFLSFGDDISMRTGGTPTLGTLESDYRNKYEHGTFQENRDEVLALLKQRKIECVLTGHSHRRGTYLLIPGDAEESFGPRTFEGALMFDSKGGLDMKSGAVTFSGAASAPVIIVSDSAGPYPRHNGDGEFAGWGSDRPGGTLVTYDPGTGGVAKVTCITASSRPAPRAAVALDYADVMLGEEGGSFGVFENNALNVDEVSQEENSDVWGQDGKAPLWTLRVALTARLSSWKLFATKLVFGFPDLVTPAKWHRIETAKTEMHGVFVVPVTGDEPAKATRLFRDWLRSGQSGYVSMRFATRDHALAERYNWEDHWNFEAVPRSHLHPRWTGKTIDQRVSYTIARPSHPFASKSDSQRRDGQPPPERWKFREVPNYAWRQSNLVTYQERGKRP